MKIVFDGILSPHCPLFMFSESSEPSLIAKAVYKKLVVHKMCRPSQAILSPSESESSSYIQ